jgi:fimbrial chaperone protein
MGQAKLTSALLLVAFILGLGGKAEASAFTVNPIRITLAGKDQSALLSLQSQSSEELRFKVSIKAWSQSPQGEMELKDTKDIVVFPALLTLGPKEERKLRIGATVPAGAVEKTYRVFVEELPGLRAPQTATKSEVKVLTKMGIPIFIRPAKPQVAGAVQGTAIAKGKLSFSVKNTGNVYFLIQSVNIKGLDGAGASTFEKTVEGWYLLAGGTRLWELDFPKDACAKSKALTFDVQSEETKFAGRMEVLAAACGP